jgi:hypothetical protein
MVKHLINNDPAPAGFSLLTCGFWFAQSFHFPRANAPQKKYRMVATANHKETVWLTK